MLWRVWAAPTFHFGLRCAATVPQDQAPKKPVSPPIGGIQPRRAVQQISSGASIARNSGAASLAQVMSLLAGYAILYMAAIRLGKVGVGTLGVILAATLLGQLVAAAGLSARLGRLIAQKPEDAGGELGRSLVLATLSGVVVAAGVLAGAAGGWLPPMPQAALGLAAAAIVPGSVATTCEGFMTGRERVAWAAFSNAVEAVVRLAIAACLLIAGFGLTGVAIALLASRLLAAGLDLYLIQRRWGVRPRLRQPHLMVDTFRASIPLYGTLVLVAMFVRGDLLILARISGADQAGLYVAGHRPVEAALVIPGSLISGLYPVLSRQAAATPQAVQRTFEKAVLVTAGLMAGATAFLAVDANLVIRILFPHGFEGAAPVLAVSALVLVPASLDSATTSLMLAQGKLKRALVPIAIGVVVLLVLNLVLDSRLGAMGAAVARPIAASVIAIINASLSLRGVGSRWFGVRLLGMLCSAVLLAALLWLGRGVPVISVPVAGLVYLGCLALGRVITIDDLRALRARPAHA